MPPRKAWLPLTEPFVVIQKWEQAIIIKISCLCDSSFQYYDLFEHGVRDHRVMHLCHLCIAMNFGIGSGGMGWWICAICIWFLNGGSLMMMTDRCMSYSAWLELIYVYIWIAHSNITINLNIVWGSIGWWISVTHFWINLEGGSSIGLAYNAWI